MCVLGPLYAVYQGVRAIRIQLRFQKQNSWSPRVSVSNNNYNSLYNHNTNIDYH